MHEPYEETPELGRTGMNRLTTGWYCRFAAVPLLAVVGCQRPMGGVANGPFAPAGAMSPAPNQPLIPIGPIQGATRVPPPSTGSTSAASGYAPPPSAFNAGVTHGGENHFVATQQDANLADAGRFSSEFRDSLGGMPLHDLTAVSPRIGAATTQMPLPHGGFPHDASAPAIGSGLAASYETASRGGPMPVSDLTPQLYPIEAPAGVTAIAGTVPMDGYRGYETAGAPVAMVTHSTMQPRSANHADDFQDAWRDSAADPMYQPHGQNVTDAVGQASYVPRVATTPATSHLRPSTDPVVRPTSDASLLWRSPSVAR